MIDIKLVRDNQELVKNKIATKGYDPAIIDNLILADVEHRKLLAESEDLRKRRNQLSKTNTDREEAKQVKADLQEMEVRLKEKKEKVSQLLNSIPNLPLDNVPVGKTDADNKEIKIWGTKPNFVFEPKTHFELGKALGLLNFEAGAKVSGSQFYFLFGDLAILEFALIEYAFKLLIKEKFIPVITPDLAKSRYYLGTGYLPKGNEAQIYTIEGQDLGLIATAEITIAGLHADEIIPEEKLPIKYIGCSHAYRQEAGAYGKYSHGLYRVHQFTKAEMFIYCLPEESETMHDYLLAAEEKIYQGLGIAYRVLEMCTGDLGAIAAKKYDIEAWMPGRNDYGEVTSTSNCTDYQARNLKIRVRKKDGKVEYIHMLNGTAIAVSRTLIAILENYQQKDGTIIVPEVLRQYMGKDIIGFDKKLL
ncbi:MAG: serine--tRNA ligase [bacterium]|nr:serine--tRNA ligase [bacterium]